MAMCIVELSRIGLWWQAFEYQDDELDELDESDLVLTSESEEDISEHDDTDDDDDDNDVDESDDVKSDKKATRKRQEVASTTKKRCEGFHFTSKSVGIFLLVQCM